MNNRTENSSYYVHMKRMTPPLSHLPTQIQPQLPPYMAQIAPPPPVKSFGDCCRFREPTAPQIQPQRPPYVAQIAPPPAVQPFGDYSRFREPTVPPWLQSYNMAHPSFIEYLQKHRPFQPLIRPPYQLLFQPSDPQLLRKIVAQLDYYFSAENLVKDTCLRQSMDEYGWVSIRLIAGFSRMKQLTDDIPMILHAVRILSAVVEVSGDKVRKRYDWKIWILPANFMFPTGKLRRQKESKVSKETNNNNRNSRKFIKTSF